MRYEPVKDNSGKECPQDTFHPHKLHQSRPKEYHSKNKYKLHYVVGVVAEEPPCNHREDKYYECGEQGYLYSHHYPEHPRSVSLVHAAYNGKPNEGKGVNYNGTSNCDVYTAESGETVAAYDRVGDEGVRGIHASHENGGGKAKIEEFHTAPHSDSKADDK